MAERTIYSEPRRTIDLRKLRTEPQATGAPATEKRESIEWSALEYEARERGPNWFLFPGVAALALIIFAVFTKSYFFAAFIVLALVVLLAYIKRGPQQISCAIDGEGVRTGETMYPFLNIKSFWIFERDGTNELSLEIKSVLSPFLHLPLGGTNPEKIRNFLLQFIPEEEHKELATDQIARSLGL